MYLVDTSVWIDFIRGNSNPAVNDINREDSDEGSDILIDVEVVRFAVQDFSSIPPATLIGIITGLIYFPFFPFPAPCQLW